MKPLGDHTQWRGRKKRRIGTGLGRARAYVALMDFQLPRPHDPKGHKVFLSEVPPDAGSGPGFVHRSVMGESGRPRFAIRYGGVGERDAMSPG